MQLRKLERMWNNLLLLISSCFLAWGFYNYGLQNAPHSTQRDEPFLTVYSENDIICLKQNIHYEAVGEPFVGKLAVATVTLNRKNLSNKTICEIVYDKGQFSWTNEVKVPVTKFNDDVNFATRLILGDRIRVEGLEDALYFHDINITPEWSKYKKKIMVIGNHVFYADK